MSRSQSWYLQSKDEAPSSLGELPNGETLLGPSLFIPEAVSECNVRIFWNYFCQKVALKKSLQRLVTKFR